MATSGKAPETQSAMQLLKKALPSLIIFGTFTASALAMKIAPLYGLLPGQTNKEILKAWAKFTALPELQMVLKPLSFDAQKFMIAVAVLHLIVALVIVLPSGPWGARIAGLWAMISMAGAEFCTRKTAFVPAGFPKEYQWLGVYVTTTTHLILFLAGFLMVFSEYRGSLIVMLNELLASATAKGSSSSKTQSTSDSKRGRPVTSPEKGTGSKRDSTPKPTSAMKKADSTSPKKSGKA
jgi:hypothetical protein